MTTHNSNPPINIDDYTLLQQRLIETALHSLELSDDADLIDDATDIVTDLVQSGDWRSFIAGAASLIAPEAIGDLIAKWVLCLAAKDDFLQGSVERQQRYATDLTAGHIDTTAYNSLLANERDLIDMNAARIDAQHAALLYDAFGLMLNLADLILSGDADLSEVLH